MKRRTQEVAAFLGGPLEFVSLMRTKAEIIDAIAELRSWLRAEDIIFLPSARTQIAEQLWEARRLLRTGKGIHLKARPKSDADG